MNTNLRKPFSLKSVQNEATTETVTNITQAIRNQNGQSLIEYLIIVSLVGVGTIGIMSTLSHTLKHNFANVAKSLGAKADDMGSDPKISATAVQKSDLRNFMKGSLLKANDGHHSSQDD